MRRLLLVWIALFSGVIVSGQQTQPILRDYVITGVERSFSDDGSEFYLDVSIENQGSDAPSESDINIIVLDDEEERIIASETLQLVAGEAITQQFIFQVADFPQGSIQVFQIEAGVDLFELAGTTLAEDNIATISVEISPSASQGGTSDFPDADFVIPLINVPITFGEGEITIGETSYSNNQLAIIIGGAVIGLIVLAILVLILRLIFSKPPKFDTWQPPYAGVPHLDPNSTSGRRQAWQGHAQNGSILAQCSDGAIHPIKLLMGMDQKSLSGWEVTALRLSQYDMYGRVARSQVIALTKHLRILNKAIRSRFDKNPNVSQKHLKRVIRQLLKLFNKKLDKRNAMLPIALDIRLTGKHGEIWILFELYQCQRGNWQLLDSWEPEMTVVGRTIQENYTYTIHGMSGGEDLVSYRKRLYEDLEWLLQEMLRPRQPGTSISDFDQVIPDTLTDMEPITGS